MFRRLKNTTYETYTPYQLFELRKISTGFTLFLTLLITVFEGLFFVVETLSSCECDFDLDAVIFEVDASRDECETSLFGLEFELLDGTTMEKYLSVSCRTKLLLRKRVS